jgi:hypothetical protein
MPKDYDSLRSAFAEQPLFEDKTWRLSPDAWPILPAQAAELEAIGAAALEFHQALEALYLRSVAGKNLLRNKPLTAPWVADYLERGKPASLVAHQRDPKSRGAFPTVLRPDLLLTDEGYVMTELDSVPGGIGLTAFLNRLYQGDGALVGAAGALVREVHASLAALRPGARNPLIALVVSEEAATYRPEMEWLARQMQVAGQRVFCMGPGDLFPLGGSLFFDVEGNPERVDIIYRFFELFDLPSIRTAPFIFEAWAAGDVAVSPPMRSFQEEKLAFALFHHHLLKDYWEEALDSRALKLLRAIIPPTWVMDPAPLPPGAVLDGPRAAGRALGDWRDLIAATQKERDLIIKISGFHETAWGARSVVLGSDCSREEWQQAVERALELAPTNLHILQTYRKPRRVRHAVYDAQEPHGLREVDGRLRLCPYYFIVDGKARLSGGLATFCPPDKKIIHGMQDAALLPVRIVPAPVSS